MLKTMITQLKNKEFRDAFVLSHISQGLAYQIYELRTQRGWTQQELADKLGLKRQSAVARMEDPSYGKLSISTLVKLSSIFDVALSIRFQNYGKFLTEVEDVSPAALRVKSFDDEIQSENNFQSIVFPNEEPALQPKYFVKMQDFHGLASDLKNGDYSEYYLSIKLIDENTRALPTSTVKQIELQSNDSYSIISPVCTNTKHCAV